MRTTHKQHVNRQKSNLSKAREQCNVKKMYFLFKILVLLIIMLTMYYVSKQFLTNIIILSLVYHNFFLYFSEEKPGRSADRMPVSLHISYHILIQLFFFFRYDLGADVSRRLNVI